MINSYHLSQFPYLYSFKPHFSGDAFAAESISDATEFELLLALSALIADFAAFFAACAAVPELLPAVAVPAAPTTGAAAPAVAIIAPLTIAVFLRIR